MVDEAYRTTVVPGLRPDYFLFLSLPAETIDVNVGGTRHMLDLARKGVRSMLYLSTSEIYGDPDPDSIRHFLKTPCCIQDLAEFESM